MEQNTFATSVFIAAPVADVTAYLTDGMNLNAYTLFSRMQQRVDQDTWLGTASGYQSGLYYHVRHRDLGEVQIVEWHCGAQHGVYHHVYPMLMFGPDYFAPGTAERGTYYHWISFVDPARATTMIVEGMPAVHGAEAHSLKAQLERRAGHRAPVAGALELRSHTIYIDAPLDLVAPYVADAATAAEWGFLLRRDGDALYDEYDRRVEITAAARDLGAYQLVEHDALDVDSGAVARTPIVLIPAAYAFAQPAATGVVMHRISAWPRTHGKPLPAAYDAEAINLKRMLEARAGNLASYARGCSYLGPERS